MVDGIDKPVKSVQMVRRYIRDAELFTDNAASGIGL
jgi:hypothetical protein